MKTSPIPTFGALLALFLGLACQAADSGDIHERINNAISRGKVGAAVFASYDQGDVTVYGYGQTRPDQSREPDGDTLFEIGSITKVFTAILVQRLVEQGRLDWDQQISSYSKELPFENESVGAITLRSLATHSSGLPRLPDNFSLGDILDPYADYTRSDLNEFLRSFDPDSLSSEQVYSNLGFGLLGSIAADAARMDYPAAIEEYILAPLGMSRSFAAYPQQVDPNMASGYSDGAVMPAWTFDSLAGAGAIVSSANDLMRFIQANFAADAFGVHGAILATQQPQEGYDMALAWQMTADGEGNTVHWHNGGTGGYASFLAVNPAQSKGWLLLTASSDYAEVTDIGLSLLAQPPQAQTIDLAPYTGVFQLGPGFSLTFSERDGQLFGQATGQTAFPLTQEGEHVFEFAAARIRVTFATPVEGSSAGIEFVQAGQIINAPRVEDELGTTEREEIPLDSAVLNDYEGEYELAEGVAITVSVRESQLFIQVTGQQAFPAFAMDTDRFFLRVVDAEIEFLRDDGGYVHELILYQAGEHRARRLGERL